MNGLLQMGTYGSSLFRQLLNITYGHLRKTLISAVSYYIWKLTAVTYFKWTFTAVTYFGIYSLHVDTYGSNLFRQLLMTYGHLRQ